MPHHELCHAPGAHPRWAAGGWRGQSRCWNRIACIPVPALSLISTSHFLFSHRKIPSTTQFLCILCLSRHVHGAKLSIPLIFLLTKRFLKLRNEQYDHWQTIQHSGFEHTPDGGAAGSRHAKPRPEGTRASLTPWTGILQTARESVVQPSTPAPVTVARRH